MCDLTREGVKAFPAGCLESTTEGSLCSPHFLQDTWRDIGGRAAVPQGVPVLGGMKGCSQDGFPMLAEPGIAMRNNQGECTPTAQQN